VQNQSDILFSYVMDSRLVSSGRKQNNEKFARVIDCRRKLRR